MSAWLVLSITGVAVAVAIILFLRTPPERRHFRDGHRSLEERLQDFPPSAQAVIIRKDRKRALYKPLSLILLFAMAVLFPFWLAASSNSGCATLFGLNQTFLALVWGSYVAPISILAYTLLYIGEGIRTLRTGYFPPLDSAVFRDTIAKKGPLSLLLGVLISLGPVLALALLYFGSSSYLLFASGSSPSALNTRLQSTCSSQGPSNAQMAGGTPKLGARVSMHP